jgi:hypothetical protein
MAESDITNCSGFTALYYMRISRKTVRRSNGRGAGQARLVSAIAYGVAGMPQIEYLDDDYRNASTSGKSVHLEGNFVFGRLEVTKIVLGKVVILDRKLD